MDKQLDEQKIENQVNKNREMPYQALMISGNFLVEKLV